jgi:glycine/D-amino acid oxidase-like deaminating enzyme
VRVGVRPIPEDGLPCVGAVPELPGYYETVTHSGVTLGPLLGRLLTREILEGEVAGLISPFRPARFARNRVSP